MIIITGLEITNKIYILLWMYYTANKLAFPTQ